MRRVRIGPNMRQSSQYTRHPQLRAGIGVLQMKICAVFGALPHSQLPMLVAIDATYRPEDETAVTGHNQI